jgi:hypothetical protein
MDQARKRGDTMKRRIQALCALSILAMLAFTGTASATTFETKGVAENAAIKYVMSLEGSLRVTDTNGFFANTCTTSAVEGTTNVFTGALVSAPISKLTFENCTESPVVVDAGGILTFTNIAGTTNGTVRSIGTKVTVPSPFSSTPLTCTTAASPGTDIGTLTGKKEGTATLDYTAVLNCGFFLPSAHVVGSYAVTSPLNLGIGA